MQITGVITKILPKVQGTSAASGNAWESQEYVVTTQEQYPKGVCFKVFGADRIAQFNIQPGETVTVSFDIKTHEYNNRVFNDITAWNVERPGAQSPQGGYQQSPQQPLGAANPQAGMQTVMQSAQNMQGQFPPQQPQQPAQGQTGYGLPF